jgi:hypothetical protein
VTDVDPAEGPRPDPPPMFGRCTYCGNEHDLARSCPDDHRFGAAGGCSCGWDTSKITFEEHRRLWEEHVAAARYERWKSRVMGPFYCEECGREEYDPQYRASGNPDLGVGYCETEKRTTLWRKTKPVPGPATIRLEQRQRDRSMHPYTCGKRERSTHPWEDEYGDFGVLRVGPDGWWCPWCDYRQAYQ